MTILTGGSLMNEHKIACASYPTKTILIDDNKRFLENIAYSLDKHILYDLFSNPQEAIELFEKSKNNFLANIIKIDENAEYYTSEIASSSFPAKYDLHQLYEQIYNPERFNDISVVVVDFQMPIMNGEEVCRKLVKMHSPIKKIMLTGEADESIAVNLFNDGIINQFILKSRPDLSQALSKSIIEMQEQYFQDLSYPIIKGLSTDQDSCLDDPIFIDFFNKTRFDLKASSAYLIDSSGSYLFIDDAGHQTWLIIKTQHDLSESANLIEDYNITKNLVEKVKNGDAIPCSYNFHDYMEALEKKEQFDKYLLPAKKLIAKNRVYSYCLTNELPSFTLDKEKILSFDNYKKNLVRHSL
jgi:CheY-like chemotaxis protein